MEMQDKLVHYSYNNFIDTPSGPDSENQNKISCDGGIIRWHFDASKFFDVTTQLEESKTSLAKEMAISSAEDPLYFIHAGLSEFIYQAVEEAIEMGGFENLQHVMLISHYGFNESHKRRECYTLQLSGRSELLQVDKIILYKDMSFEEAKVESNN